LTGKGTWLVMTATKSAPNTYTGQLFQGTGPAFDAVPFPPLGSPGGATVSGLGGTGPLTFIDANNAAFTYTVAAISQTKRLVLFGQLPDRWSALGMTVIVASGLMLALRERARAARG